MAKVPVTASTDIAGEMVAKTMEFEAPRWDAELKELIEFAGGSKALFLAYMERVFVIDKQAEVRRVIKSESSPANGAKPRKGTDFSRLGV